MGGDLLAGNSRETRDALAADARDSEETCESLARRNTFAELLKHVVGIPTVESYESRCLIISRMTAAIRYLIERFVDPI